MKRLLSPAFFALVVGAFFLPFVSISCNAGALQGLGGDAADTGQAPPEFEIEATGWNLVTGSEPKGAESFEQLGQQFGGQTNTDTGGEPSMFAIAAFAAAILGFLLSFLPRTAGGIAAAVLGGLGAILMFLLRNDISGDLPSEAGAFLQVEYKMGYWLALLFFVLALASGIWVALSERRLAAVPGDTYGAGMAPPPPPPGGTSPPSTGFSPPPGGTTQPPGGTTEPPPQA